MGWNQSSISKLQRCNRWDLGIDKQFHPTFYSACDILFMLGFSLNHVGKGGPKTKHESDLVLYLNVLNEF